MEVVQGWISTLFSLSLTLDTLDYSDTPLISQKREAVITAARVVTEANADCMAPVSVVVVVAVVAARVPQLLLEQPAS